MIAHFSFQDEDGEEKDPEMYGHLTPLLTAITEGFTQEAKAFYEREFKFFKDITAVSGIIAKYEKGQKRQKAVKDALKNIVDQKKVLQVTITKQTSQPEAHHSPILKEKQLIFAGLLPSI